MLTGRRSPCSPDSAELATGNLHHANNLHDTQLRRRARTSAPSTQCLLSFAAISAMLRGFANGGSSLTGLEAISNGVSVFRKPVGTQRARVTMSYMVAMLGSLVLGISILAWQAADACRTRAAARPYWPS